MASHVIDLAHIYTLLGDTEKAVEQLEFLLSRPGWVSAPWLKANPVWRPLRGDPRFEALFENTGTDILRGREHEEEVRGASGRMRLGAARGVKRRSWP